MKWLRLLPVLLTACCLQVSALSTPATTKIAPLFEDSTQRAMPVVSYKLEPHKQLNFFQRLRDKVVGLFSRNASSEQGKGSTKSLLGWIALGATGLGIILLFAGTGAVGVTGGVLLLSGILTGLVALVMPRSKEDKAAGKKSNTGAIIAIVLGVGLIIAIVIALSSWK